MEEIQEEAKRRFPIGCYFKSTDRSSSVYRLDDDDCVYRIVNNKIWAHDGFGLLYDNGIWAIRMDEPKVKKSKKSKDIQYEIY